jgi:hypothetical protein
MSNIIKLNNTNNMAKKEFKTGLDVLFEPVQKLNNATSLNKSEKNQLESNKNEIRATFIMQTNQLIALKALAYWQRKQIKTLLAEIVESYLSKINIDDLQKAIDECNTKTNYK